MSIFQKTFVTFTLVLHILYSGETFAFSLFCDRLSKDTNAQTVVGILVLVLIVGAWSLISKKKERIHKE